ncbi:hypothetical protein RNI54_001765 [Pseudomonas putida]|nr:hypothetical protein [Pseudomonas putida]
MNLISEAMVISKRASDIVSAPSSNIETFSSYGELKPNPTLMESGNGLFQHG